MTLLVWGNCGWTQNVSTHGITITRVQDLQSRFAVAKLASLTSNGKVIPMLTEILDTYGNSETQIFENGVYFGSNKMKIFAHSRDT